MDLLSKMREFRDKLPTKELKEEFEIIYMHMPIWAVTIEVKEKKEMQKSFIKIILPALSLIFLMVGCCPTIETVEVREQLVPVNISDTLDAMWWDGYNYMGNQMENNIYPDTAGWYEGSKLRDNDTIVKVIFKDRKFYITVKDSIPYPDTVLVKTPAKTKIINEPTFWQLFGSIMIGVGIGAVLLGIILYIIKKRVGI